MKKLAITLFVLIIPVVVPAQSTLVFKGLPIVKISEGGESRTPENITRDKAANLTCIVSEISGTYYWPQEKTPSFYELRVEHSLPLPQKTVQDIFAW